MKQYALLSCLLFASAVSAVEAGNLSTIRTGEENLSGLIANPPEVAKVRLPLKMTSFEQVIIQNGQGARRIEHKALAPVTYTLRATINRSNHFYVSDWHIETVPMKWERDQKIWQAEVKFYKRYGQEQELEEYVGTLPLNGRLLEHDKGKLFVLVTKAQQQFQNKRGNPLLIVNAGQFVLEDKGNIAKSTK